MAERLNVGQVVDGDDLDVAAGGVLAPGANDGASDPSEASGTDRFNGSSAMADPRIEPGSDGPEDLGLGQWSAILEVLC